MKSVLNHPETYELYGTDSINTREFAMFSGGNDSIVSTHFSMNYDFNQLWEFNGPDMVYYIDTGVGIEENKQYVIDVCDEFGWPLIVTKAEPILDLLGGEINSFRDFAKRLGFPSPRSHSWIFRYLKERGIRELSKFVGGNAAFYTGVRRTESLNRMGSVQWRDPDHRYWTYFAPIASWSKDMLDIYRMKVGFPTNPVREKIHRSGDCYCGAYGWREQELTVLQSNYPDLFQKVMSVEQAVIEERGEDDEKSYWGWGKADRENLDKFPIMCGSCVDLPKPDNRIDGMSVESKQEIATSGLAQLSQFV